MHIVAEKLSELNRRWYEIIREIEGLKKFKYGDERFETSLNKIRENIITTYGILEETNPGLKELFPDLRENIDKYTQELASFLKDISSDIEKKITEIKSFRQITREIEKYKMEIYEIERELSAIEKEVNETCSKYNLRKKEFEKIRENIVGSLDKELEKIKKKFLKKIDELSKDCEIYVGGVKKSPNELFDELLKDPNRKEFLKIIKPQPRGILGIIKAKEEEDEAKSTVLKYLIEEVLEKALPLKKKIEESSLRLEIEFADLKSLEISCNKAKKKKEEFTQTKNDLKSKIEKLKTKPETRYSEYNKILELRDAYLKEFEEKIPVFKDFIKEFRELLEKYEPPEEDIEKRELKKEIKELEREINELKNENNKLNIKIKELEEKYATVKEDKDKKEKEIEEKDKTIENLKKRLAETEEKLKKSDEEIASLKNLLEHEQKKREELEEKLEKIKKIIQ